MSEIIWNSILQKIEKVPTPENTQAWSFRYHSDQLEVFWDPEKGNHFFDLQNHAACLSLGCLLEYFNIAAQNFNYKIEQKVFNHEGFNGKIPVSVLELVSSFGAWTDLEQTLSTRSTNRGTFRPHELPGKVKTELNLLEREFPHLQISFEKELSKKMLGDLSQLEADFFSYPEYIKDLLKNIIFNSQERLRLKTGIYHEELSLFFVEKIPLFLAKKIPAIQKLLPHLGIKSAVKSHSKRLIKSSKLLVFGTTKHSFESLIDIGRAGTRAWLILNKNHFAVHPMTALALQVYELNTNQLPPFFIEPHKKHLEKVSQDYAIELKMKYPAWVLRYGEPRTQPKKQTGLSKRNPLPLQIVRNQITG